MSRQKSRIFPKAPAFLLFDAAKLFSLFGYALSALSYFFPWNVVVTHYSSRLHPMAFLYTDTLGSLLSQSPLLGGVLGTSLTAILAVSSYRNGTTRSSALAWLGMFAFPWVCTPCLYYITARARTPWPAGDAYLGFGLGFYLNVVAIAFVAAAVVGSAIGACSEVSKPSPRWNAYQAAGLVCCAIMLCLAAFQPWSTSPTVIWNYWFEPTIHIQLVFLLMGIALLAAAILTRFRRIDPTILACELVIGVVLLRLGAEPAPVESGMLGFGLQYYSGILSAWTLGNVLLVCAGALLLANGTTGLLLPHVSGVFSGAESTKDVKPQGPKQTRLLDMIAGLGLIGSLATILAYFLPWGRSLWWHEWPVPDVPYRYVSSIPLAFPEVLLVGAVATTVLYGILGITRSQRTALPLTSLATFGLVLLPMVAAPTATEFMNDYLLWTGLYVDLPGLYVDLFGLTLLLLAAVCTLICALTLQRRQMPRRSGRKIGTATLAACTMFCFILALQPWLTHRLPWSAFWTLVYLSSYPWLSLALTGVTLALAALLVWWRGFSGGLTISMLIAGTGMLFEAAHIIGWLGTILYPDPLMPWLEGLGVVALSIILIVVGLAPAVASDVDSGLFSETGVEEAVGSS